MEHTEKHLDIETLKRLHPLNNLNRMQLELLTGSLQISSAQPGTTLMHRGDNHAVNFYLLKGRLRLSSNDGRISEIIDDSPQALNPIARLTPRQYEVTAITPVDYLMIDRELLDAIMGEQGEGFTATEISLDEVSPTQDSNTENQLSNALLSDLGNDCLVLPSLPDIAVRVGREMNAENTDAHKLASIIQTDPVITTKLIRAANSPLYAGVSPVDSCTAAVIRLGAVTTHNLVLTFALRELFLSRSPILQTHMRQLWQHSIRVSAISYVIAQLTEHFNPEHALLAGLLHDIGTVAVLSYAKQYPDTLNDEVLLQQVINDLRGIIGARILSTWDFLDDLVTVAEEAESWLRDHPGPADYADLVIVAQLHSFIGTTRMQELPTLDQVPALQKLALGKLTPKLSMKILDRADDRISQAEALLRS